MPTHGFSSRLQQRYASTTAQGSQQNVRRAGVYHRGLNKLTSLGAPGPAPASTTTNRPPSAPLPVQTSSLRKENGGQDVTAVLVNRGGGKKVGWGSSIPTPAPSAAPPPTSLGPTPADAAAKETAEKEKATKTEPPVQPEPPAQQHPPLPPPPALENKNIPWALHPPSQPPTLLGGPHGDYPHPGERGGPGGGPPREDYRDRGRYDSRGGGYPPHDRYGGGYDGGRYGDHRRYSDGPYGDRPPYDERRHYRERDYDPRGPGEYNRDRDRGYYRNDYRGGGGPVGGYHRGGYGRERDCDHRGGGGGPYQDRGRYYRGDDRRWSDYDRSRHEDYRDGPGRPRSYDAYPYDGRRDYDRSVEPPRFHARDEPPPPQPREAHGGAAVEANAPPNDLARPRTLLVQEEQPRGEGARPSPASRPSGLHQVPPKSEVDAALEAVRLREEAEERARHRKDEGASRAEADKECAGEVPKDDRQRPSEDAGHLPADKTTTVALVQEPTAILQNSENQSSGEASGDASAVESKVPLWSTEIKRAESSANATNAHENGSATETQQLEKIGELRQSALVTNSAGQDSADVKPKLVLRQREEKPKPQKSLDEKPKGELADTPVEGKAPHGEDELPAAKIQTLDTDSTESHVSSPKEPERETIIFEECQTEEERRQKQQQIILQQVAAVRDKKEKLRRKEKKTVATNAPQIVSRAKGDDKDDEQKQMDKEQPAGAADAKPTRGKRRRRRRPRTQGVLYKRLQDGSTFVDADLTEEQIASIEKQTQLRKQQQAQQQRKQQQAQQQQQRMQEKANSEKVKDMPSVETPRRAEDRKTTQLNKSPKEVIPAPPPAVSAWKQGPPPGIVKSPPTLVPQNLGLLSGKKLSPDVPLFQHDHKADEWAPPAEFPKLGQGNDGQDNDGDGKETASWIPPPVDPTERRVIAAPLIMENVGFLAADWSVGHAGVDTDWTHPAPAPVMNGHADDDTAHLTDGSGAVPRDLLSSAPGSEDDGNSAGEEKQTNSATVSGQSKRSRRGRSRRGGRGRSQKNKAGEDSNKKEGVNGDFPKQKSSSRKGKKQHRSGGQRGDNAPPMEPAKPFSGGGSSKHAPSKPPRSDKSSQQKSSKGNKPSSRRAPRNRDSSKS